MLFTLKPVIFAILLWILQLELRPRCFGSTPVCVWGNAGCSITQTSLFHRQTSISPEQPIASTTPFSWSPLSWQRPQWATAKPRLAGVGNDVWSERMQGALCFLATELCARGRTSPARLPGIRSSAFCWGELITGKRMGAVTCVCLAWLVQLFVNRRV